MQQTTAYLRGDKVLSASKVRHSFSSRVRHTDPLGSPFPTGRHALTAAYLHPLLQLPQANVAFQDFVEDSVLLTL